MMHPHCGCGKRAFTRGSTGHSVYCRQCFTEAVQERVRKTINRYSMFRHGDSIAIGLSGGKDSAVLLNILTLLERSPPRSHLAAVVVDEGIHGYRDEAIKCARLAADQASIELHLVSFEELYGDSLDALVSRVHRRNYGQKPCSICGTLRRNALNKVAREIGATKLATGHNLDDETQTCLLNVLRGDTFRFRRLSREPTQKHPELVPRVKPLVEVAEREIQLYALAKKLHYHDIECPYAATAMRNDVRRFLMAQEEKRPGTLMTVLRFHDRLLSQENKEESPRFKLCQKCGEPTSTETCSVCNTLKILGDW
ncbi:MAG: TIGR00269 family protein [Candidatus Heimdallarchaeota archaeon]